jgi:hypothetical protein
MFHLLYIHSQTDVPILTQGTPGAPLRVELFPFLIVIQKMRNPFEIDFPEREIFRQNMLDHSLVNVQNESKFCKRYGSSNNSVRIVPTCSIVRRQSVLGPPSRLWSCLRNDASEASPVPSKVSIVQKEFHRCSVEKLHSHAIYKLSLNVTR